MEHPPRLGDAIFIDIVNSKHSIVVLTCLLDVYIMEKLEEVLVLDVFEEIV